MKLISMKPLKIALVLAFVISLIAGCQQYWRESGVWDIQEHQGLLLDLSNYYHRHAVEENGQCRSPVIDGVTRSDVIEETEEKIWVTIRYYYRDFMHDDDDDCDQKARWLRCSFHRACRGFATRTFEVVREEEDRYRVTEMSGDRRR